MKRIVLFFATLWLGVMGASAQGYRYDVNNDGNVNITDAIAVVNKVLGKGNPGDVGSGEAVDLGLPSGTLWSSCNIGASSPEEYGNYYAWGETEPKSDYSTSTYQYYKNGSYVDIGSDISGTQYDVATALWGDDWRMPTKDEFQELINNCTSEWTTVNGVNGYKFTSKTNGKSIFLPAAGFLMNGIIRGEGDGAHYWSAVPLSQNSSVAYDLYFYSSNVKLNLVERYIGTSVRPVRPAKDNAPAEPIDLGLPSGTKWASCNVGASKPEEAGDYYAWGELGDKSDYRQANYQFYVKGEFMDLGDDIGGTKYDVARMKWGDNWRMPTYDECEELKEYCTVEFTTINGIQGRKLISNINGNSIFLPAAGYRVQRGVCDDGDYVVCWSSTLSDDYSGNACILLFEGGEAYWSSFDESRTCGLNIRPVRSPKPKDEDVYVDLGLPSGTKWARYNIGATSPEQYGEYFAWGEVNEKSYYGPSTYHYSREEDNGWYDSATGKYYSFISIGPDINSTEYDVAHMRWGGKWQMPEVVDYLELRDNCNYEWTSFNGVQGGKFTSKINGKSIFLPAAGYHSYGELKSLGSYGSYWLSRMTDDIRYSYYITSYSGGTYYSGLLRSCGHSIRPVYK